MSAPPDDARTFLTTFKAPKTEGETITPYKLLVPPCSKGIITYSDSGDLGYIDAKFQVGVPGIED